MLLARRTVVKWMIATVLISIILSACGSETPSPMPTETSLEPTATLVPASESSATFEHAPCPFNVPEGQEDKVDCGFVVVPEDHNNPDGPSIRLAVVVVKDQSDEHQPDPVILLAGGPGERAVCQRAPTRANPGTAPPQSRPYHL